MLRNRELVPCWLDQILALERTWELMLQEMTLPFMCAHIFSAESCPTLCNPMDGSPPVFCLWVSPGKNTRVGCNFLLPGIFGPGIKPASHASAGGFFITLPFLFTVLLVVVLSPLSSPFEVLFLQVCLRKRQKIKTSFENLSI